MVLVVPMARCYQGLVKALPLVAFLSLSTSLVGCKSCNNAATNPEDASFIGVDSGAFTLDAAAFEAATKHQDGGTTPRNIWSTVPGATANLLPNMGIGERFQIEKASRPQGTPNVESVVVALTKGGLNIATQAQHLAQPFGGRYCVGAEAWTAADAGGTRLFFLSLCEFVSPEVAGMSREHGGLISTMVANRTVHAHKKMTLTIRLDAKTTEDEAAATKAFGIFDAL